MNEPSTGQNDLALLLDLNGEVFLLEDGYWVKWEARLVEPSAHTPHGIKYALTLHDRNNQRVVGYDNAHALRPGAFKAARKVWDHRHRRRRVEPYDFLSVSQLIEDFWKDVDAYLARK